MTRRTARSTISCETVSLRWSFGHQSDAQSGQRLRQARHGEPLARELDVEVLGQVSVREASGDRADSGRRNTLQQVAPADAAG